MDLLDWKQLFGITPDKVLGLDIGSSAVKMVQLRKDNTSYAVTAAAIAQIENNPDKNPEQKEVSTVNAIRDCLEPTDVQNHLAVCGVSGPEVAVRYFKFPPLPAEELEGAVTLEATQVCPFNVDNGAVDYQSIPDDGGNTSGFFVAATNRQIKNKTQLAEKAALSCVLMDVDGLALLNCLAAYEKPEAGRTTTVLNVGSSCTTLAIMSQNNLPFIRDITYAGNDVIKQLAAEHNIPAETVRNILTGREHPTQPTPELGDSLAKACQKLITDVTSTLRYYATQQKSAIVEKIFVCGGFALTKGFVELLNDRLPEKVVLWNPFEKLRCDAGPLCKELLDKNGPAMSVAAGLAMRSI